MWLWGSCGRRRSRSPGRTQQVDSLVALVLPPLYWPDIPGRLITCLPEREDHTSLQMRWLSELVLARECTQFCSHAKVRKKNNSAPGSDCSTGAGVIHHAETHSEWLIPSSHREKVTATGSTTPPVKWTNTWETYWSFISHAYLTHWKLQSSALTCVCNSFLITHKIMESFLKNTR